MTSSIISEGDTESFLSTHSGSYVQGHHTSLSHRPYRDAGSSSEPVIGCSLPYASPVGDASRGCVPSERNMFQVGSSSPTEGGVGTVITAMLNLNFEIPGTIYICLVAGVKYLETKVRRYSDDPSLTHGDWVIHAAMPPRDRLGYSTDAIPITAYVLVDGKVLDFAKCGYFTYTSIAENHNSGLQDPSLHDKTEKKDMPCTARREVRLATQPSPATASSVVQNTRTARRRRRPIAATSLPVIVRRPRQRVHSFPRHHNSYGLVRISRSARLFSETEPLTLDLVTPLDDICQGWDAQELRSNRRLVKFTILSEGCHIMMHCTPISQDDYDPTDVVISCIRHEQLNTFHVTSVDVLHLFQNICGQELSVKEKTRLRRNIQCFSPIRLSKTDRQFASFYYMIMDLPIPRPRTIEKKLKVFKWSLLKNVLEKILSKYCISEVVPQSAEFHLSSVSTCPITLSQPEPSSHPSASSITDEHQPQCSQIGVDPSSLDPSYPGIEYPPTSTSSIVASQFLTPAFTAFDEQSDITTHWPSPYECETSQSSVCSTASDVESMYLDYGYGPSIPYPACSS